MRDEVRTRLVLVGVLWVAFALALASAAQKSPTMDEGNHIARGAAYLGTGDPRLSVEHPPLVNVLSALPVHLLNRPTLPLDEWWDAAEWYHFADNFLWSANPDPDRIVFLARLPVIGLGMMLAALVFRWANARFGCLGGLLAAVFCALDPNILAHTRLSTTDLGGAFFTLLATYALWRALRQHTLSRVLWAGVAFGLALSTKLSALVFAPLLALAALLDALAGGPGRWRRLCGYAGIGAAVALVAGITVWASYGFQMGPLDGSDRIVAASPYVQGILSVIGFSTGGRPAYLLGQHSDRGWWYYFPVAFAVKTPPATLIAALLAGVLALRRRDRDDLLLLVPPLGYFLVSVTSRLNIGYRHLLPVLPFLAVHIGRLAPTLRQSAAPPWRFRVRYGLPVALAVSLVCSTILIYPHFLTYFNLLGGGPQNGWRILADSNIDWGQDLKGLRAWMEDEGVEHVRLSWFGSAHAEAYGISHDMLPGLPRGFPMWEAPPFDRDDPSPGVYVISVTNLVGVHFPDHDLYAWFRGRAPDAKIGYSLFVYRVTADG